MGVDSNAMESSLMQIAVFLQEVDLKNDKIVKLAAKLSHLKEVLIEKESELLIQTQWNPV